MKKKIHNLLNYLLIGMVGFFLATNPIFAATTGEILNLTDQITDKKDQLKTLEENLNYFQQKISEARQKSVSLKNQIELVNDNIQKTELEIQEAEIKIEQADLEIIGLNSSIEDTKKKIELQKEMVAYYLRELQRLKARSPMEIFLLQPSFSKFFDEMKNFEAMQNALAQSIQKLKEAQSDLQKTQADLKERKDAILTLKKQAEDNKAKLEAQKTAKTLLIGQTFASEAKFQALLIEAQKERSDLDSEISRLENEAQAKLRENDLFPYGGNVVLTWPVPKNEITAGFHDPDYPYRYIYEHPGIDIRAKQGTPVTSPAPGYVLKVRNSATSREYSYIVIAHAGGISTVYIHLSRVYVQPDTYVARGQVIGLSGGTPGTRGAGLFTTGPHLHFEVRANSVPVNPLGYLVDI